MKRFDPHSYFQAEQGQMTALNLDLVVDFARQVLRGEALLVFAKAQGGRLDLDSRDLKIDEVTQQDGAALEWRLAEPEGFMGSRLEITRRPETKDIRIRYQTSPEASALQWLEPANTAGGEHPYLFSQCQPHHARSMVPLQDSPRVRFSYNATITVPEALTAVMSAAPGEASPGTAPGSKRYQFAMPQAIPAYLLALAVGDIASQDLGPRSRVYAEPATLAAAVWEFAEVDRMLLGAEALFGDYPWERFDFLVMPPAFPYGGMENPRLTFLTPTLIAGDRSLVNVLAHELAHSWTGNLVTNATMNDFWLNEGFTVWAERRIIEALEGQEVALLGAAVGRDALDADLKHFGDDSPYTQLQNDLSGIDPDEVYSTVPYEKGFLFVSLLEKTMGRDKFDNFVRAYIEHFKFTSITTAEFEAYVEAQQPGLLARVEAEKWLRGKGLPNNSPLLKSSRLDAIQARAAAFENGQKPSLDESKAWSIDEWQIYLSALPQRLSSDDCDWLEQTFSLNKSGNSEILCKWLEIAAASAYEPSFDRMRSFLGSVGRMKYLKPIYSALKANEKTQALAHEIFAASKTHYHPIARGALDNLLK